jgi:hypothetical protein
MSKRPPLEVAPLEVVYKNNNYILLKAMDFRWKLPFIFRTCRFLMHVLVKATAVWRTDFAGGLLLPSVYSKKHYVWMEFHF